MVWEAVLNLELALRTKTTSTLSAVVYLLALVFLVSVLALFHRRRPSLHNPPPPFKGHINIRLGVLALYCLLFAG
jgi:high-affinity Fe2+/Pb2+ permease